MENEIIKFEEVASIISSAGNVYEKNKESYNRAFAATQKLLSETNSTITQGHYDLARTILKKLDITVKEMMENRKPLTQIMDALKKEFTRMESDLNSSSETQKSLRNIMNTFATEQDRIKKEEEKKLLLKMEIEKERISVLSNCEIYYRNCVNRMLLAEKNSISNILESCQTIEQIDLLEDKIKNYNQVFYEFESIKYEPEDYVYIKKEEIQEIIKGFNFDELKSEFKTSYEKEIEVFKKETIDKIPTKKTNILEKIELQNKIDLAEGEKARAEALLLKKKAEDEERLRKEKEEQERNAEALSKTEQENQQAKLKQNAEKFKAETAVQADLFSQINVDIKTKTEYDIDVLDIAGWILIFQFWFENNGKTLNNEKIEKFTLKRAKEFCEKQAEKEKQFIVSEFIKYNEKIIGK